MKKVLTVETLVQKEILEKVLMKEIADGFWKKSRPQGHCASWEGVKIKVGKNLGTTGFKLSRNYNFMNPDFYVKKESSLLEICKAVEPDITKRMLKKQLVAISQIVGGRLLVAGGTASKVTRRKKTEALLGSDSKAFIIPEVKRVPAIFAEA